MDEALQVVIEMSELIWKGFKDALKDVTPEEINWRPLPQANSINVIVRHLRIEAEWHVASLERGEPMPGVHVSADVQQWIDSVPLDFERNLKELEELYTRFIAALRRTTLAGLEQQSELAYQGAGQGPRFPGAHRAHLLSFHQTVHLVAHGGQICTIRNLYRKTRGEPARFFPENPSFPT